MNESEGDVTPGELNQLDEISRKLRGMNPSRLAQLTAARNVLAHAARTDADAERVLAEANRLLGGAAAPLTSAAAAMNQLCGALRNVEWRVAAQAHLALRHSLVPKTDDGITANRMPSEVRVAVPSDTQRLNGAYCGPVDDGIIIEARAHTDKVVVASSSEDELANYYVTTVPLDEFVPPADPKKAMRREFRKVLRMINRLITQFIRRLDSLSTIREFAVRFSPFLMTHGNHPPDVSTSLAFSFSA